MDSPITNESLSPGWDAISAALKRLYGDQEPEHFGTLIRFSLGGPDPLDGISVYWREKPRPHWHFVTFGLSELYGKRSEAPESGFGFELTFRLARDGKGEVPHWVLGFLNNLARYVFESGTPLAAGHHINLNGTIALDYQTAIRAIAIARDPELPTIDTPNGPLKFLQVVGITLDELTAIYGWKAERVLETVDQDSLLITDLDRPSALDDPATAARVQKAMDEDGSATSTLYTELVEWKKTMFKLKIRFSAVLVAHLKVTLRGRIPHNRPLNVRGERQVVIFRPSEKHSVSFDRQNEGILQLSLTAEQAIALAEALQEKAGTYNVPGIDRLQLEIVRTEIKGSEGEIVEVIG